LTARAASPPPEGTSPGAAPESDSSPDAKLTDDWYAARRAFWDADLAEAERLYQELILEIPDQPDAYGELGNLYYSEGAWVEAAKMYHQAGLLLIDQGESQRAASLVGILSALNPNLADELQEELSKAR
jgi:tetratricopeptide (TPR) repeat protein